MNKFGFTLIELILSIAISSMLAILLFTAYYQTSSSSKNLNRMILIDTNISVLQNQLEHDITGIFVPEVDIKPEKKEKEEKNQKEKKQENQEKQKKEDKSKFPEKVKTVAKPFFVEMAGKNLKEFTFITANPLQIYGQSKPRIVRVSYFLRENKNQKNSFTLFRKENLKLDSADQKDAIEYEIIDNIRSLNLEFLVPVDTKKERLEYKKLTSWPLDSKAQFIIPLYINVKVSLWEDTDLQNYQDFEFKYPIWAFDSQFKKIQPEQKMEDIFKAIDALRQEAQNAQNPQKDKKQKDDQNNINAILGNLTNGNNIKK